VNMLAPGVSWIDLQFLGRPSVIATAVIQAPGSVALVDPGPTRALDTLERGLERQGLRLEDVTDILLTHIHLDHAGATGTIVRRHPHIRVFVHQRGAVHMADPTRLIDSAARLYGNRMSELWGDIVAVPRESLVPLEGGESIDAGGRTFEVAYTPGHASHHVSYFDRASGLAFVGDAAGMAIDGGYVLPPTPPPDIDVEGWRESVGRIEAWSPHTLFLTHFGPTIDVRAHLQALLKNLDDMAACVRTSLDDPGTDEERSVRFVEWLRRRMRAQMTDEQIVSYPTAAPFEQLWAGLARYWRKRARQPVP
jgi:glyoxylase-like metal-dependent hydrolase (beta-lactamase superfamily II)